MNDEVKQIQNFVLQWNAENPVDRWWRNKHNVAFNSPAHRGVSLLEQYAEFYEDRLYANLSKSVEEEDVYVPDSGDIFKPLDLPTTLTDEEFDDVNLDDF